MIPSVLIIGNYHSEICNLMYIKLRLQCSYDMVWYNTVLNDTQCWQKRNIRLRSHETYLTITQTPYKALHGKYITQTHLGAFYVCAIWDTQAFSLKNYRSFNTKSYCSDVCGYHRCPQTLAEICRNMGICCSFRAVAARGKYMGFVLFHNNHTADTYGTIPITQYSYRIMYVLAWRTVCALTRGLFWCLFPELRSN